MQTHNFVTSTNIPTEIERRKNRYARTSLLALFVLVLTGLLAGCVVASPPVLIVPPSVEAQQVATDAYDLKVLMVSYTEKMATSMFAKGVQIYQCLPNKDDAAKFEWTFVAPEAVLFDDEHNEVGKHYVGPTWESIDGSKVVGAVKARVDSPSADAIPWLLLYAKSTEGTGTFSDITSIQRVDTTGGKAPQVGCDSTHVNEEVRVPYTAVYFFYTMQ
jgi:hypothetical protein